jgi:hypothetical protein
LYAKLSGYDLDKLFDDLIDEIGYEKADNFVWNALQSLSDGDKGIRIDLNTVNANGAYAYLIISQARIDLEESDNSAMISWSWGESRIATADEEGNDVWTTIEDIWEDIDMGELDDFENFINEIIFTVFSDRIFNSFTTTPIKASTCFSLVETTMFTDVIFSCFLVCNFIQMCNRSVYSKICVHILSQFNDITIFR